MPPVSHRTRLCVGGAFALTAGALSLLWSLKGDPVVDRMYREFEPDGVPLPVNRRRLLSAVLTPVLLFAFLSVVAGVLIHIDKQRQRVMASEPAVSEVEHQPRYGIPPSGPPGGAPPSGGSSSR